MTERGVVFDAETSNSANDRLRAGAKWQHFAPALFCQYQLVFSRGQFLGCSSASRNLQ